MSATYRIQQEKNFKAKIKTLQKELPIFCESYFRYKEIMESTSVRTRYGYAVDLRNFFAYLTEENEELQGLSPAALTAAHLRSVRVQDIEGFLASVTLYTKYTISRETGEITERTLKNGEKGRARKLSSIRSLFKWLFQQGYLETNIAALVGTPKLHEKAIVRLEANEVANLLDIAEKGAGLTSRQQAYHERTNIRDIAILTLFLGTGIRISELVGIDIKDINFASHSFLVTRKGGNQEILHFGAEVTKALQDYFAMRQEIIPVEGHESAFFLSMQRKRITVLAVENLVKKYAQISAPLKKITPHKLRSTYGTMLYEESGDIYLVADVLGHKDVNTTKKHYAALSEERRRAAAKMVKLRED
ncbi:MAG: tyrosine-type recombinase/integrase [Clostridiales bacterium]|nr:tyrosine-type recombinase/integrase [Clostridiales bacterium]